LTGVTRRVVSKPTRCGVEGSGAPPGGAGDNGIAGEEVMDRYFDELSDSEIGVVGGEGLAYSCSPQC